jgi:hypothetical protein
MEFSLLYFYDTILCEKQFSDLSSPPHNNEKSFSSFIYNFLNYIKTKKSSFALVMIKSEKNGFIFY